MKLVQILACAAAVLSMGVCAPAMAQDAGGGRGMIAPMPRPMPPSGWQYVWVAPVYQTVADQTWVPERVEWVAEWREISPGRYEQVWRQLVTPGHWVTSTRRVLVSAGHWELVAVSPPWPPMIIEPPYVMPPVSPPIYVRGSGTVGVEGYSSYGGEDLSRFSPLSEWPK
jgi:hypothetical protein